MDSVNSAYTLGVKFGMKKTSETHDQSDIWLWKNTAPEMNADDHRYLENEFGVISNAMRAAYLHGVNEAINISSAEGMAP
jgi:hypothetical protein